MDWIKDFSISRAKFDHLNLKRYPIFKNLPQTEDLISPTRTQHGLSGPASSATPRLPEQKTPPVNHEPFINSRLDKVGPPRLEGYEDNDKSKLREMP